MSNAIKNIVTVLLLLVVAAAGYYFFFMQRSSDLDISRSNEGDLLTAEFIKRLNELQQISFSRDIFTDRRFLSLTDFSTEPDNVSSGRSNPFSR